MLRFIWNASRGISPGAKAVILIWTLAGIIFASYLIFGDHGIGVSLTLMLLIFISVMTYKMANYD